MTAYVIMDREPVFEIVDNVERVVFSEEQLYQRWDERAQKAWQKQSDKISSKFSGGNGSEEASFQIASVTELKAIEYALEIQQPFYFVQIADLYILQEDLNYDGFWKPIGEMRGYLPFSGGYDGGGYRNYGLRLEAPGPTEYLYSNEGVGFFNHSMKATFRNIHIVQPEVIGDTTQSETVGFLVGCGSLTQIVDCFAIGIRIFCSLL